MAKAQEWLNKAVDFGAVPVQIDSIAEFKPLHGTKPYRDNYERALRGANPCRYAPEFSAFDFWIGDWDVYANGRLVARNIITKEMNGCIIHERYQTTNGAIRGESINYYDPIEKKWKQNWVSNSTIS